MFAALLKKDLLIEFRTKEIVVSMATFGVTVIVLFAFAFKVAPDVFKPFASGLLWVTFLFISVLGLNRTFSLEKEFDAFGLILSAPVNRGLIFLSKWLSAFVFLVSSQVLILPLFYLFLHVPMPSSWTGLLLVIVVADLGITSLGSLVSGIAMRTPMSEILLPVLLFPLVSPLMIAAIKCTDALFKGVDFIAWKLWFQIIVTFVIVFSVIGYLIFDHISEE